MDPACSFDCSVLVGVDPAAASAIVLNLDSIQDCRSFMGV